MNDLRPVPCVVVIDDNPDDRDEVRQMLQQSEPPYHVIEADSGASGLAAMRHCPGGRPDFLVLDHDLPDLSAPDLLKQLADAHGQPPCPVVVLTDATATELGRVALRAGAQDYLSKDWLSPGLLARTLENAAERWAMTRQLHERQAELTRQVERESYLLALSEATRALDDPKEIKDAAAALLGRHLGASRVVYAETLPDGRVQVQGGFAHGVPPIDGSYSLSDYGSYLESMLLQGRPVMVDDMANAPQFSAEQKAGYVAMRIGAHIEVPLLGNGRLVALLAVHQDRPRTWTAADVDLATETLSRTLIGITFAKSQQLLREREERLAQLVEAMPSFNAVVRGPQQMLELANDPFCALAGCDLDMLGQPLRAVLPAFGEAPFATLLDDVYRTGQPFRAQGLQIRLRGSDDDEGDSADERFVDLACLPLHDLAGEVDGVLIHGVDRTEQVATERALRESRRELQAMADNLPAVVARFDTNLRHVFVNAAAEGVTGRPRREFIGHTNQELGLPPTLTAAWDAGLRAVFADGRARTQEFRFNTPTGDRDYRTRLVPERDVDGIVRTLLTVTYDVTDERASERALQDSARQKDLFLATLAHELRNPMAPLRSGLELLRRQPLPEPATKVVGMMDRQLSHLVYLVDDLLDLSRVNLGKIELHRQPADVDDAVAAAVEACRPQLDARDHRLLLPPRGAPLVVDADWTRLVQIVANLLSNAAKYTPPGGEIEVSATREGHEAVVRVRDSGVGLDAHALPHIWGMFSQVENTRDKAQGGLGIGLWLTRHLTDLHGGSVAAFSEGLGHGSTFVVRLPLAAATPVEPPPTDVPSGQLRGPVRILIVDDSPDNATSLAALLRSLGHEAVVAHSGPEALALLPDVRPALMLLDIGMPGMDGYEVARQVRATPGLTQPLLVAVTGWGSDEDRQRTAEAGFDLHLTKPVRLASIEALFAPAG